MRRSIDDLRIFYGEPAGALARRMLARRLDDAWGEADNCDVLGLGYATPWLEAFVGARRLVAAMPGGQGVELWPQAGKNRTVLVDDRRLPFAAGSFDRILLVHALEEADDAQALMLEAVRALEEGVLTDIREGDVGAILGWGFAPWSGGPFSWLDMIGAGRAVQICEDLASKYGARFAPPDMLRDMAAEGRSFYPAPRS